MHPHAYICAYLFVLGAAPQARLVLSGVPIYLLDVVLIALLVVFCIQCMRGTYALHHTSTGVFVTLFLVFLIPGFIRLALEASSFPLEVTYIAGKTFLHTAVFFVVVSTVTTRRRLWWALGFLAAGAVVASAWAILESAAFVTTAGAALKETAGSLFSIQPNLISPVDGIYRGTAGFFGPNMLGGFLALFVPIALFAAASVQRPIARIALIAVTGISALALIATFSRSAWLGAALGIGVVGIGCLRLTQWRRFALPVISVVFIAALFALIAVPGLTDAIAKRGAGFTHPLEAKNVQLRIQSHQRFFTDIVDNPSVLLTGVNIRRRDIIERGGDLGEGQNFVFVSNSWLLPLARGGIGAFLAYAAIYFSALVCVWRHIRSASREREILLTAGFGAALVSAAVVHMLDNYFGEQLYLQGYYLSVIALAICLSRTADVFS
jgi:hypothetical protein